MNYYIINMKYIYKTLTLLLFFILLSGCSNIKSIELNESIPVNVTNLPIEENGGLSVNIQDQTTRPFAIRVNQILNSSYTLAESPTVNSYNVTLTDALTVSVGDYISFLEQNGMPQLLFGEVLAKDLNVLTLDTPVPYAYIPQNTTIFTYDSSLIIDGSTDTQTFSITNFFEEAVDITRILLQCSDDVEPDDGKFCGDDELIRGLVFRKKKLNGNYINYWNVKNNGDLAALAYDVSFTDSGKPPEGIYSVRTRLTYGGQSKHGVVIRLEPNESIELLVQDDLTGITSADLMVEGHFIQN